ncbi:MAG: TIGR03757 family integrating conjugative element protein [Candidatus Thiodiazotropha sp. (ex Lucinoma borealis)]|nr:TIGR03757 family integrating conjugative element protein [Candidatus Thiodiazotropha sp. (ex Lucinoma borealis)]
MVLVANVLQAAELEGVRPFAIEAFTSSDLPITGGAAIAPALASKASYLRIYNLDGMQLVESGLSIGLTGDSENAKRVVLQRIHQLDEASRLQMQHAAMGLAKAVQYGIDRYPAIVFDGRVVVYGINDLKVAFAHYDIWRTGEAP